jgi:hypothetical protein
MEGNMYIVSLKIETSQDENNRTRAKTYYYLSPILYAAGEKLRVGAYGAEKTVVILNPDLKKEDLKGTNKFENLKVLPVIESTTEVTEVTEVTDIISYDTDVQELIIIKQELVIAEALKPFAEEMATLIEHILQLEVNEDTYKQVDKQNASINKYFEALEVKRKETKKRALAPYEQFEAVYKDLITEPYKEAKQKLKNKLDEVKNTLQAEKQNELVEYVTELLQAYNLDWLDVARLPVQINRSASITKAKNELKILLDRIKEEYASITDNEIMLEYKDCLNLAQAINMVTERKKRVEQERELAEKREQAKKEAEERDKQNAEKAKAVTPTPTPLQKKASEQMYEVTFKVAGSKQQFVALREFLASNGMKYDKIGDMFKL